MEESDDIIQQRPRLAVGVILVVGAGAYAAISLVVDGSVDTVETGLFAVVFAVVYVAFAIYAETIEARLGRD